MLHKLVTNSYRGWECSFYRVGRNYRACTKHRNVKVMYFKAYLDALQDRCRIVNEMSNVMYARQIENLQKPGARLVKWCVLFQK